MRSKDACQSVRQRGGQGVPLAHHPDGARVWGSPGDACQGPPPGCGRSCRRFRLHGAPGKRDVAPPDRRYSEPRSCARFVGAPAWREAAYVIRPKFRADLTASSNARSHSARPSSETGRGGRCRGTGPLPPLSDCRAPAPRQRRWSRGPRQASRPTSSGCPTAQRTIRRPRRRRSSTRTWMSGSLASRRATSWIRERELDLIASHRPCYKHHDSEPMAHAEPAQRPHAPHPGR
jgi:hypothetical protein